jgi:hypothetical protein
MRVDGRGKINGGQCRQNNSARSTFYASPTASFLPPASTAQLVHLPVHASWLDQIEIYFSVVQRKVVTPNDLTDLDALAQRLLDFQDRYNQHAAPFAWKFTRTDLDALLERIAAHERDNPLPVAA